MAATTAGGAAITAQTRTAATAKNTNKDHKTSNPHQWPLLRPINLATWEVHVYPGHLTCHLTSTNLRCVNIATTRRNINHLRGDIEVDGCLELRHSPRAN